MQLMHSENRTALAACIGVTDRNRGAVEKLRELQIPMELILAAAREQEGSPAFDAAVAAMKAWGARNWTRDAQGNIYGPNGEILPIQ